MTQNDLVLGHMEKYGGITSAQAFGLYGVTRLSAIIWELRHLLGYEIDNENKVAVNRFGKKVNFVEYRLRREA